MSTVGPIPSRIVILLDPSGKHSTLDEDRYRIFYRFTRFVDALNLINTRQFRRIDLHVPTNFTFDVMRPYLEVYIHTYFVDDEEITETNDKERQKISESIRICCETVGEEFIKRGVMESSDSIFQQGIALAEQLRQMDLNRMNGILQ